MITSFKRIDHINIVVKDIENAKKFFVELGFTVNIETTLEGEWIDKLTGLKNAKASYIGLSLSACETNLELLEFHQPESLTTWDNEVLNKTGFRHIAFEVQDIEKIVAKLKARNVHFLSEIQEYKPTKKKICYFYGPENIVLELAEYGK